jgi:Protein of unknown function (DUF2911)
MKYFLSTIVFVTIFFANGFAQMLPLAPIPPLDKSQMDMSTFPPNYQLARIEEKATLPIVARIIYSRPLKNSRLVFGGLLEYGKVWRFGANENTEIEFYRDVKIKTAKVKKGKYSVFAIPMQDKWTIIFNKDLNTWGSFKYDIAKDVLRVDVPVQKMVDSAEAFFIYFDKSATGFNMNAGWDDVKVTLPMY